MWLTTLLAYCEDPDIKMCPSVKKEPTGIQPPPNGRAQMDPTDGTCYEYWTDEDPLGLGLLHKSSYGMNGWDQCPKGTGVESKDRSFAKTTVPMAYRVPLIAPDTWRSGYPGFFEDAGSTSPDIYSLSGTPGDYKDQLHWFVFNRHLDRINFAFVDGHVERVYLPERAPF